MSQLKLAHVMSSPQTCLVLTIPVCDGWVVLEHSSAGHSVCQSTGMVIKSLQGWRHARRRAVWGRNCGEVAIAIQVWQGGGQRTRGGGGSFGMGLRGMQDLPNLNLLLPLLQNLSRLSFVVKLASNALPTFQTPNAPPRNRRTRRKLSDGTTHK